MAKTRRKKINKSPLKIFKNSRVMVVDNGVGVKTGGYRTKGKQVASKDAKPIHIGRVYTGVPRGKTYPYGSKRQGFPEVVLTPRKTVVTGNA